MTPKVRITTAEEIRAASTQELLEAFFGPKVGQDLVERVGRLRALFTGLPATVAHRKLLIAAELAARALLDEIVGEPMSSPASVQEYLIRHFQGCSSEVFSTIWLDNRHRVLTIEDVFHGTIDNTTVYPREIARRGIAHNAAALILAHNHPSGVAEPSEADRLITRRIRDCLELLDIRLLDHFVIGGNTATSLASRGLL